MSSILVFAVGQHGTCLIKLPGVLSSKGEVEGKIQSPLKDDILMKDCTNVCL